MELKKCPFCGETAKIIRIGSGYEPLENPYVSVCQNGFCNASVGRCYPTKEDAAKAWNRRANEAERGNGGDKWLLIMGIFLVIWGIAGILSNAFCG